MSKSAVIRAMMRAGIALISAAASSDSAAATRSVMVEVPK